MEGFDELERALNNLSSKAEELNGEHRVPFTELFNEAFMRQYTSCATVQDLFDKSGFTIENQEDFARIPDDEWDAYIQNVTQFADWKSMMDAAAKEYLRTKLGL
jgi:hypothetical protein